MRRLVIFDLDGTLIETVGDLAASCNAILRRHELPEHSFEEYRHFVGNGVKKLVERALPDSWREEEQVERLCREFIDYYTAHIDCHSYCYEGVRELLGELIRRGVQLAVVSNKFQQGTSLLIGRLFPEIPFLAVFGHSEEHPLKPDPRADLEVMRLAGVAPAETIHVGDTATDICAAIAAGALPVGVSWGFRTREELLKAGAHCVIDTPSQLLDLLTL